MGPHKRCCQPAGTAYGFELAQYAQLIERAISTSSSSIVSIGIGTGATEGKLRCLLDERLASSSSSSSSSKPAPQWYGVDPDPTSHNPLYPRDGVYLAPTAAELVAKRSELGWRVRLAAQLVRLRQGL